MLVTRAEWPLPGEQPWQEQGHWWDLRTQSSPCCCWFCCTPPPSSPPPPHRPSQPQVLVILKHCTHFVRKSSWSRRSKRIVSSNHSREFCCCDWMKQSPHYSSTMISWQNVCSTVQCIQLNTKTSKFFSFEKWFLGLPPPNNKHDWLLANF